jgi:hypothetical protein
MDGFINTVPKTEDTRLIKKDARNYYYDNYIEINDRFKNLEKYQEYALVAYMSMNYADIPCIIIKGKWYPNGYAATISFTGINAL